MVKFGHFLFPIGIFEAEKQSAQSEWIVERLIRVISHLRRKELRTGSNRALIISARTHSAAALRPLLRHIFASRFAFDCVQLSVAIFVELLEHLYMPLHGWSTTHSSTDRRAAIGTIRRKLTRLAKA
jgi:hypothetical protein